MSSGDGLRHCANNVLPMIKRFLDKYPEDYSCGIGTNVYVYEKKTRDFLVNQLNEMDTVYDQY